MARRMMRRPRWIPLRPSVESNRPPRLSITHILSGCALQSASCCCVVGIGRDSLSGTKSQGVVPMDGAWGEWFDREIAGCSRSDGVDGPVTASECQDGVIEDHHLREPSMNEITTLGIDLAKNVFQVHGVDTSGAVVVRKAVRRVQVLRFFEALPRCLVGHGGVCDGALLGTGDRGAGP